MMHHKLTGFLALRQGNHTISEYCNEFNNFMQYKAHYVDTDEKKVKLFCKGLTIQQQDRLILSTTLSFNELVSAAIDQQGTMKAYEVAEEKKRKRIVPGSSGGCSSGAPLKYRMVYTPPVGQLHRPLQVLGKSPTVSAIEAAVQPHPFYTIVATRGSPTTIAVYTCRILILQLREVRSFRQGLSTAQARQCTVSSGNHGEPA
jgi:hypothetical protein